MIALIGGVMGLLLPAAAPAAGPKIRAVRFSGNQAHPVITITGQQLGKTPRPNPAYHPLGHPLCPPKPILPGARYGFDYGIRLYLEDSEAQPVWSAGRYRPSLNELDCIGIVLVRFTPSRVVYRLGAAYPNLVGKSSVYTLKEGDTFVVAVNGASFKGRVHYR